MSDSGVWSKKFHSRFDKFWDYMLIRVHFFPVFLMLGYLFYRGIMEFPRLLWSVL